MHAVRFVGIAAFVCLLVALPARPASAQWQIDSKDGKSNIKIGFLVQPQAEVVDTPDGTGESKNLYLRRIRIMFGGKVADKWTFFFETDSPNVGKTTGDKASNPTGAKEAGNIYIQDAYVTYNQGDAFKVDAGMMLIPLGHNHNQSAATLLPVDYGVVFLRGKHAARREEWRATTASSSGATRSASTSNTVSVCSAACGARRRETASACRAGPCGTRSRPIPGSSTAARSRAASAWWPSAPGSTPRTTTIPTRPTCSSNSQSTRARTA